MKKLIFSLVTVLAVAGCNSDGDGDGGNSGGAGITLDQNTASSMSNFVQMGLSLQASAIEDTQTAAGKSLTPKTVGECGESSYTGDINGGTATISYDGCTDSELGAGISISGGYTVTWSDTGTVQSYEVSGGWSMSITAEGQTTTISFDPMDFSIEDNGTDVTTSANFKFNISSANYDGYLSMETVEDLVAASSDPGTILQGKIKMNDGNGNIFYITWSGGTPTVTSS